MMSAGLPILLVSPKGEASELIQKLKIGYWVPSGNPELLTQTIAQMLNDPQGIIRFSRNSIDASKEFTREKQALKFLDAVDIVIERRKNAI